MAAVQLNDPDGLLWAVMYALGAAVCLMSLSGVYHNRSALFAAACSVAALASTALSPGFLTALDPQLLSQPMDAAQPDVELGREFFGALINFCCIIAIHFFGPHRDEAH